MAESVDALVSNTSGFTSIPVRPRVWVPLRKLSIDYSVLSFFALIEGIGVSTLGSIRVSPKNRLESYHISAIFLTVFAVLIVSLPLMFVLAVFDHQFVF